MLGRIPKTRHDINTFGVHNSDSRILCFVNIVDVDKGDRVVSIAKCPKEKEDELDIEDAQDMVSGVETSETIAPTESQEVNLLNINGDDE